MEINKVILETLGMMGFTFLVGMGVALIIKMLVELFYLNVSNVVRDYRVRIAYGRKRRARLKKVLAMVGKDSDVELLRYMYENKNNYNGEEEVDALYDLFNFYKGIYKDNKENDGINELIKYYNGEV